MEVKELLYRFEKFNQHTPLFKKGTKILATCSGGADSMLMVFLFKHFKLDFSIAHVNFQLRGKDSDMDEKLVEAFAQKTGISFFRKSFQTKEYAVSNGISIEMAARELRYKWFHELTEKNNFDLIATAHHLNDHVETILLNITRGTGQKGYHGILHQRDDIIRPLLCFNKEEILFLIKEFAIPFREDKTNEETDFQRNKIRHLVVPVLKEMNPDLENTFYKNSQIALENEKILVSFVKNGEQRWVKDQEGFFRIEISDCQEENNYKLWLKNYLLSFDFNQYQIENILKSIHSQPGNVFISSEYILNKDRESFILKKRKDSFGVTNISSHEKTYFLNNFKIQTSLLKSIDEEDIKNPNCAYLNFEKLNFPLKLRPWKNGDFFIPFGMKGKKKVSDFLIDQKIPLILKEEILILESDKEICWIVGFRIDERFKVENVTTNKIFKLEIIR
jgi:tRNA(Ile)-lysidine synthase